MNCTEMLPPFTRWPREGSAPVGFSDRLEKQATDRLVDQGVVDSGWGTPEVAHPVPSCFLP